MHHGTAWFRERSFGPTPHPVILSAAPDAPCDDAGIVARSEGSTVGALETGSPPGPVLAESRSFIRRHRAERAAVNGAAAPSG